MSVEDHALAQQVARRNEAIKSILDDRANGNTPVPDTTDEVATVEKTEDASS